MRKKGVIDILRIFTWLLKPTRDQLWMLDCYIFARWQWPAYFFIQYLTHCGQMFFLFFFFTICKVCKVPLPVGYLLRGTQSVKEEVYMNVKNLLFHIEEIFFQTLYFFHKFVIEMLH